MNRRTFALTLGGGLVATSFGAPGIATSLARTPASAEKNETPAVPYQLSVMLWTIYRDLPFEQRLEKVARAGYRNVELVGEYQKWNDEDFNRALDKRKQLGIRFDCTAGLKHGVGNPADRGALLAEFRATLPVMERIECPAMIIMSGNTVPGMTFDAQARG